MTNLSATAARARKPAVPSAMLGALIFVAIEVMFFSGVLSAATIVRAGAPPWTWLAPGQPSLALPTADINVGVLLASGLLLAWAPVRAHPEGRRTRQLLLAALALGAVFLLLQLRDVSGLMARGLGLRTSRQAGFYFLLGGLHTVHAAATLVALAVGTRRFARGALTADGFAGLQVLWYFVVLMWPVIYLRVCR